MNLQRLQTLPELKPYPLRFQITKILCCDPCLPLFEKNQRFKEGYIFHTIEICKRPIKTTVGFFVARVSLLVITKDENLDMEMEL